VFRRLGSAALGDPTEARALFKDPTAFDIWFERWRARTTGEDGSQLRQARAMDKLNPIYIPRNHKVQEALDAATGGDLDPFRRLLSVLERPFERRAGLQEYEVGAPEDFGPYRTFCGT
ncbi:MAG: hypothetical protein ACPHO4_14010, partial [Longimicrobiales bacterium]